MAILKRQIANEAIYLIIAKAIRVMRKFEVHHKNLTQVIICHTAAQ
jgi:hypothetical protein